MKLLNEPFETTVLELVSILLCVIVGGQIACFWEKKLSSFINYYKRMTEKHPNSI